MPRKCEFALKKSANLGVSDSSPGVSRTSSRRSSRPSFVITVMLPKRLSCGLTWGNLFSLGCSAQQLQGSKMWRISASFSGDPPKWGARDEGFGGYGSRILGQELAPGKVEFWNSRAFFLLFPL